MNNTEATTLQEELCKVPYVNLGTWSYLTPPSQWDSGELADFLTIQFTGVSTGLSAIPQAGDSLTFTANATSTQYKFWYRAGYGTPAYDTNQWQVMQEYSAANECTHTFTNADNYIVIAHGVEDPDYMPSSVSLIGMNVHVGGSSEDIQFTRLTTDISGAPEVGDAITFTAAGTGTGTYYKFWCRAGYGTSAYNTNQWVVMQEYSTNNTCTHTFDNSDNYVVIVHATKDPTDIPSPVPMIGMNVEVEDQ